MNNLSCTELLSYIKELLACNAFELHIGNNTDFYIPYMMNDALECYLMLENGHLTGNYLADYDGDTSVELITTENKPGIIFHQGIENVFTLWFENSYRILKLYRYDQIGHFWVKGQEHWRQLVYIIGTIYDKYNYMGNVVCNEKELALLPLMEFAPFRYYSPLHESLDEYYTETKDGTDCMIKLAEEAGDKHFLFFLRLYKTIPAKMFVKPIAFMMNHTSRQPLYELIYRKMQTASISYPERHYPQKLRERILQARSNVSQKLYAEGFHGEYPRFHKDNVQILATEEHPFTILESETFDFKIQLMISKAAKNFSGLNAGFFKKKGNLCDIISLDKLIDNYFGRN